MGASSEYVNLCLIQPVLVSWAVITVTKYHKLSGFKLQNVFSHSSGSLSPRSGWQQGQSPEVLVESLPLPPLVALRTLALPGLQSALWWPPQPRTPSPCALTWYLSLLRTLVTLHWAHPHDLI